MLEAARGWLTPAVLFVLVNLVIATIAVASRLMPAAAPGDERRGLLLRAPSLAVDRLRASLSFSRLGLAPDHAPLFDDAGAPEPSSPRAPPAATGTGAAGDDDGRDAEREREAARIERSRSEAAAEAAPASSNRRPRARRTRRAATEEPPALAEARGEPAVVEVDARADDFIRRFREQLRLQRHDSILRYRDTLRRTGTA
ncbi:hypothetical protein C2845_PM11G01310 [Panicum miliaceum]|uniref:DUF4408 domain-containing protein n=1 Tax=Panicum miliaceum TaxID=4540 RepID=A0A3L6RVU9_PANMI|nr:hypothetical protein C2845_PM11G01310 [Panicum miliaceum]